MIRYRLTPLLAILLMLIPAISYACLNDYSVTIKGDVIEQTNYHLVPFGHHFSENTSDFKLQLREKYALWQSNHNLEAYSDYGVLLTYLGRCTEALEVFKAIEKIKPGLYATAANMGTVYELLGENKNALRYIEKAIAIDPSSHNNSEWLHVRILKAKISGDQFINDEFLIGTSFGDKVFPVSLKSQTELIALRSALFYQLNERVSFIKPNDRIIARLMFELGNVCALTQDVTTSLPIYQQSMHYGYHSKTMMRRYNKFMLMQAWSESDYDYAWFAVKWAFLLFIPAAMAYFVGRFIWIVFLRRWIR